MNERDIFIAALQIDDATQRRAYLGDACGGDSAVCERVEELLNIYRQAGSFLESPPPGPAPTIDPPEPERLGTVIGPYKLLQQIGEGGMGVVYMAEQEHPVRRKVALKIIKPGMDSRQVVARFEAERQALALMDHQHIARVLDVGTTNTGQPYFVMELVKGMPITRYCDDNHLTPKERLELFIPVCQAIQHAHQKGIIHRDIKPSNVMVTLYDGKPVPKVIDFGVAKAMDQRLTEQTMFTQFGQVVGTIEYMSPEQAEMSGLDIDTRSDIYSLGVLLYELLTGSTPFEGKRLRLAAFAEMLRIIREEEPPKPSTRLSESGEGLASISAQRKTEPKALTKLMRGELDWIVMKSLEKDRTRRYETASGLARDIQCHLADEPVEACPPSAAYRFRKFARRNKRPVTAASIVVLALVGGIIGTTWGLVRAERGQAAAQSERRTADRQRDRAQHHYERAFAVVDRLLTRVGQKELANVPYMDETRRRLLEDALEFYRGFLRDEGDAPAVRREIGLAHGRIARIEQLLGRLVQAEESWGRAIVLQQGLVAEFRNEQAYQLDLAQSQRRLAILQRLTGRSPDAERILRHLLEELARLSREHPDSLAFRVEQVEGCIELGLICHANRRPDEAEASYTNALELAEALVQDEPANPDHLLSQARCLGKLGLLSRETSRPDDAEKHYVAARGILVSLAEVHPANTDYQSTLASVHNNLANLLAAQGRRPEAEEAYRQALLLNTRLAEDHPDLPDYKMNQAMAYNNLGLFYSRGDDPVRAEAANQTALKLHEELMQRYKKRLDYATNYAGSCGNQAKYLHEQGKWRESLPWYAKTIDTLVDVLAVEKRDTNARLVLHNAHHGRAGAYLKLNQPEEAANDWRRTVELSEGERHFNYVFFRPRALAYLGEHVQAASEVEEIVSAGHLENSNYKELASVCSLCSAAVRGDLTIDAAERERLSERYAVRAVALLAKAGELGFFKTPDQVVALRNEEKFQPLQGRDDFLKLLKELEPKSKASSK